MINCQNIQQNILSFDEMMKYKYDVYRESFIDVSLCNTFLLFGITQRVSNRFF